MARWVGWWMVVVAWGCGSKASDDDVSETGTSGPPLSHADVEALCADAASQEECEAVPMAEGGTDFSWCAWETWTAASIDADSTCTLGAVEENCGYQRGGDLCASFSRACDFSGGYTGAWDGRRLGFSEQWCGPPGDACSVRDSEVQQGPPECACLCDANWPDGA